MLEHAITSFALLGAEWVLWLLVVLSVFSVTIMIERMLFYSRRKIDLPSMSDKLGTLLDKPDIEGAKQVLSSSDGMEASVLRAGLSFIERGKRAVEESMDSELVRQKARFDAYLIFLGTLGNNAPFIGLLGTVLGIIRAFRDLSLNDPSQGGTNAQAVMAGISEALVATAVGLAVALPAVVAFNYFKTVVKRTVSNTETLSKSLSARLDSICSD